MRLNKTQFTFLLFSIFLLSFSGCSKDYVTGKNSYNWFSLNSDIELGKEVLAVQSDGLEKKKVAIDSSRDEVMLKRLKGIVARITKVSHIPDLPYEVHLAETDVVNAWAAPGGKIMVYSGLWDPKKGLVRKESDTEIAAVLAHEIAHCTARHVTKSLTRQMTIALAGAAVSTAISGAGYTEGADLFNEVFYQGMNIYVPSYSRKNESQADYLGLIYMAKAGYDPRVAVELWKRASKTKGDKTSLYATHPSSGERAAALEKHLPEAMRFYEEREKN